MTDSECQTQRALCTAAASWLRASGVIATWGLGLSLVALALLALGARSLPIAVMTGLGLVAIAGWPERYLALRIKLDASLFEALTSGGISSVDLLDASLAQLGLRKTTTVQRRLHDRVRGAQQLVRWHAMLVTLQSLIFVAVVLVQRWK